MSIQAKILKRSFFCITRLRYLKNAKNVVEFRLSRPQVANAYNDEMITEMLKALSELSSQTRVLLITGEG